MNPQQEELHAIKPANQLTVAELQTVCHQRSHAAGWWDDYIAMPDRFRKYFLASRYALIHSEATEAFEGLRKTRMDDHLPRRKGDAIRPGWCHRGKAGVQRAAPRSHAGSPRCRGR